MADYATIVVLCHIAKTVGLKTTRELNSASTANNPCMTRVAGVLAAMAAMGTKVAAMAAMGLKVLNRNALDFRMAVSSSEYSSVCFF